VKRPLGRRETVDGMVAWLRILLVGEGRIFREFRLNRLQMVRFQETLNALTDSVGRLQEAIMSLRDDLDAGESRLETSIGNIIAAIRAIPSDAADVTQADVDKLNQFADALDAATPTTPVPSEPTDPSGPAPVDGSGDSGTQTV
jgi:hypothetical protein